MIDINKELLHSQNLIIHQKLFSVFPYLLANSEINLKHAG